MADYDQAIKLAPKYWVASELSALYLGRCQANYALGNSTDAVSDCSTAIFLEPPSSSVCDIYLTRGLAYEQNGDVEPAIQDFRKVLSLSPACRWAYIAETALGRLEIVDSAMVNTGKCTWLVRSQFIVGERNLAAKRLIEAFLTYGTEDFDMADSAFFEEFTAAIEELLPAQQNFIEQWKELGATPGEEGYWGMELDAQTLRLESLEEVYQALLTFDPDLMESGVEKFHAATSASRQAENAMLDLYQRCTAQ